MERSPWRVNEPHRYRPDVFRTHAAETLGSLRVLTALVYRAVKGRYQGTAFGFAWSLITPLLLFAVYALIFGVVIRIDVPDYPLFLLAGLLPWHWLTQSLDGSAGSLFENGRMLLRVKLPPQVLPLASVMAHAVTFVFSLPILLVVAVASGHGLGWGLLGLPWVVAMQALFIAGLALPLSTLCVVYRDLRFLIPTVLLLWFFLTPITYPAELIPEAWVALAALNPFYSFTEAYREIVYNGAMPPAGLMGRLSLIAMGSLALGVFVFEAMRGRAVEEL